MNYGDVLGVTVIEQKISEGEQVAEFSVKAVIPVEAATIPIVQLLALGEALGMIIIVSVESLQPYTTKLKEVVMVKV